MSKRISADSPSLIIWVRLPLAILAGVCMGFGMAPYDLWYVAFAGLVLAFWLFRAAPGGLYSIGTGWGVGLGYFGLSLGWIVEPFMVDAAATGWMAPFALFGMAGGLALFWGLAFWGAGHVHHNRLLALAIAWSAAELARAYVFTGFPWALVSYIWAPTWVIQWVSVVGPHGLTLLTMISAAMVVLTFSCATGRVYRGLAMGGALVLMFGGGLWLTPALQDLSQRPYVRLIQPNAAQHEKWDPDKIPVFFNRQVTLTESAPEPGLPKPELIVWPETALPVMLERANDVLRIVADAADGAQVAVGVQRGADGTYFNSLALLDGSGFLKQVYDKHHLVPFGEYMPAAAVFKRWNIAGLAARADGGYTPGPGPELLEMGKLGLALPLICYEAVFPQDVYRTPARPDFLLQITNDAWFGQWSGPYQHLAQARIRAIEQGLPLLRAANTGVSAVIDGGGHIIAQLGLGKAGKVDAPLPPPLRVTLYSRVGDLPALILLILLCFGVYRPKLRNSD
ncbi:apolipoprotein N-acyltransferase [Pelagimonas varians]|uniref:Apolipoprotein N-acyltransferase n=1 Tax=Pelagimonas varians TaxID=696760 RepID=A0A238JZV0_9RHOB|nr:apolipoprotein N-acyltransferase [Pelagimonas varians]PYG33219.1 apolipoprotein N-acyltransferase [Pelagimonas varians]SMX36033.1 Apolipoprotein N-acyltransferase [Pelagimonas varians]